LDDTGNMLKRLALPLGALLVATACGQSGKAAAAPETPLAPTGATIGPDGYATIRSASPAPFTPAAPHKPKPLTAEQIADHAQFRRVGDFQNKVRGEVQALVRRLRTAEKGNFVTIYFDNEGDPSVVFQFLRDGPGTLRKYTKHPRFVGKTVRFSQAQLLADLHFMMETFREDRVFEGGGIGRNSVDMFINVPEPEFRALVTRKGVKIPESVELKFTTDRSASESNQPLPPQIARLVRSFPRSDRPLGIVNAINSMAEVVLEDGCFRAADQGNALVIFPLGAQLFIDREGYLAYGSRETPGYARVGEELVFPGSVVEVTAPELLEPVHKACGAGKVIMVNATRSAAAERVQCSVTANAQMFRQLRETYGLSEAEAGKVLAECTRRNGGGTCLVSPPPPVPGQTGCPAGARLSFGLCRTPAGYVRPLPKWIAELLGRAPAD
jgi:hypothetical protein